MSKRAIPANGGAMPVAETTVGWTAIDAAKIDCDRASDFLDAAIIMTNAGKQTVALLTEEDSEAMMAVLLDSRQPL
jgi:hypothetical protein